MKPAPFPENEKRRLIALREASLLDTPTDPFFEAAVQAASTVCSAPMALVSLIDEQRQWFKARIGLHGTETGRDVSICGHAILQRDVFVVPDATRDDRFFDNPFITGDPHVAFYAGVPILTPDDLALGTLCVLDNKPRDLAPEARAGLAALGTMVSRHIETRRANVSLAAVGGDGSAIEDLVESAHDLVQCASPDGQLVYVNRAWRTVLGHEGVPLHHLTLRDVLAPDSVHRWDRAMEAIVQSTSTAPIEAALVTRDGRRILVEATSTVKMIAGRPVLFRSILRDVTEQRRLTHELAKAERIRESHEQIVAHIPIGLIVLEDDESSTPHDMRVVSINPAAARLGHIEQARAIGMRMVDLRPFNETSEFLATCTRVIDKQTADTVDYERRVRGRLQVAFSAAVFPLQGRRVGVAIRDVTAVRRADLRVTESEMQLRTVVDGVSEGLLVAAEDGSIESANRAACTLFHLDAGPLPNLGDFLPFLLHEGAEPREVEARRTDGTRFPAEVMACSIAPDEKRRYVVVVRDLTSRREMDRVKKEFVSTVSHELRTPLTSIRGGLGLLEGGVLGKLEPRALEMVRIARSNAERLGVLLNDILDLEKIDAGKLEMHFDEHGADALVHGALDATRGMADAAGIELQAGALPPGALRCDEGRIVQVLSNLISNAIKFSTRGQSVRVDVDTNERRARFAIVDQGPGIPPDQLHKLFQRFQQLDGSDRRKVGGTGLGLAIVKAIVEQHGGIVGVESTPGHGSTFWFELPRSAPQATHAAPPP